MIQIAVDAMGGDFAPGEVVRGGVMAAQELSGRATIHLVGDRTRIERLLKRNTSLSNLSITHASQVISMDESPVSAVKQKKDSSMLVAVNQVAKGGADAVVSAGNTGAYMAACLLNLGRLPGVERPPIATVFPTTTGEVLLLDMGANVDCRPKHLFQFAHMGSVYSEKVMRVSRPRVGLLNIGKEPEKGNEAVIEARELLAKSKLNFLGNVESNAIFAGEVDVVVCDGFVGNILLKYSEAVSQTVMHLLKEELSHNLLSRLGALILRPTFTRLKRRIDYDEYGGALLLGLNGICVKAHGRARAKAIKNAIRKAFVSVDEGIIRAFSNSALFQEEKGVVAT